MAVFILKIDDADLKEVMKKTEVPYPDSLIREMFQRSPFPYGFEIEIMTLIELKSE